MTRNTLEDMHVLGLMHGAAEAMTHELHAQLAEAGYPDIRPGHGCVVGNIDPETGSRLTDVAACAGYTKQAVGEAASDLERLGYLERRPDPNDGRAKVLVFTPEGLEMRNTAFGIIAGIEKRVAAGHGREGVEMLREILIELAGLGQQQRTAA